MKKLIFTSIAVLALSTNLVQAASFDCTKASTDFEKSICNDKQLSDLDEKLAEAYKKVKSTSDNPNIKQGQLAWIKETRKCGGDSNCIQAKYQERLATLNKSLETKVENIKEATPAVEVSNSQNAGVSRDESIQKLFAGVKECVGTKNFQCAKESLNEILKLDQNNMTAKVGLVNVEMAVCLDAKNFDCAVQNAEKWIQLTPEDQNAQIALSKIQSAMASQALTKPVSTNESASTNSLAPMEVGQSEKINQNAQGKVPATDNQKGNIEVSSEALCSKLKSSPELIEFASYVKQLLNVATPYDNVKYTFDTNDKINSKWLVEKLKPINHSIDGTAFIRNATFAMNECALSIRDSDLLYLMASDKESYESLKEKLDKVAEKISQVQTIRKVDASGNLVVEKEKTSADEIEMIIGGSGRTSVMQRISENNEVEPLWIPSWLLILTGGEQLLKNTYPEIKADLVKAIATIEENKNNKSTDIVSTDLVAQFKSVWCKNVDNETKAEIKYKDLFIGDLCLAPDIVLSNISKLSYSGENLLSAYSNLKELTIITYSVNFSWFTEGISNKDYRFETVQLVVLPNEKKIYLNSFIVGVCPEDETNSLNEGNSFRKALENKYGKVDSFITEYEIKSQQVNQMKSGQKEESKQAISVQEAIHARESTETINLLDNMAKNIPKDLIHMVTWKTDGEPSLGVEIEAGSRLMGCNSFYFNFTYIPPVKLIKKLAKVAENYVEDQKKHTENASTPKF